MKAIVIEKPGGIENLIFKDVPKPYIKENEVLVEVKAIGINPVDYKIRSTEQGINMMYGGRYPVILGWDISGVVAQIGENVSKFNLGDNVFGMVNFPGAGNAYAEFVASPENHLAKMPENVSYEEAAATTLAALTALQALQKIIKKHDKVLIHAGSGGVGHFAIQIAKQIGAYVTATSSAKNKDFIMSVGADEHIDYRTQKIEEILTDIDFVLDSMAGEVLLNSVKVMKEGGTIVSLAITEVSEDIKAEADKKNVTVLPLLVKSDSDDMKTLSELLKNRSVTPHVSKIFSFEEMAKAHLELESGRTIGKVVVKL